MPKAGFIVARISFLVLAASMLGVAMLAAPAVAQTGTCSSTTKCFFAVSVTPTNPTAGTSNDSFQFTIKNEATPQSLGAVQISAPAGFTITGASIASGAPASATASSTSSSALFQNLSLASGASATLTVIANVPCASGSYTWGIEAKQANQFNGNGNDFQLDSNSTGNLSGTLAASNSGSCVVQPCTSGPCTVTSSSSTTTGTITTSSPLPQGDFIEAAMDSASTVNYSCNTYQPVSDAFSFNLFNSSGTPDTTTQLTGTLRIHKSAVIASGHTGASTWQICYASTASFNAVPGTTGTTTVDGVTYNTGQLLDCSSTQGPPCVQARNKNNAGDVIVTFLAVGDPIGRG